jgi:hypothetical protein
MKEYKKLVAQRRRGAVYRNQIKYGELAIQRSETALIHCVRLEGGEAERVASASLPAMSWQLTTIATWQWQQD